MLDDFRAYISGYKSPESLGPLWQSLAHDKSVVSGIALEFEIDEDFLVAELLPLLITQYQNNFIDSVDLHYVELLTRDYQSNLPPSAVTEIAQYAKNRYQKFIRETDSYLRLETVILSSRKHLPEFVPPEDMDSFGFLKKICYIFFKI